MNLNFLYFGSLKVGTKYTFRKLELSHSPAMISFYPATSSVGADLTFQKRSLRKVLKGFRMRFNIRCKFCSVVVEFLRCQFYIWLLSEPKFSSIPGVKIHGDGSHRQPWRCRQAEGLKTRPFVL